MLDLLLKELTFFRVFLAILTLITVRIIFKYMSIWLYITSLRKKGGETCFEFPMGYVMRWHKDLPKGDAFAHIKELVQKNPRVRVLGTNFAAHPLVYLIDPDLIKEFLSDPSKYTKASLFDIEKLVLGKGLIFSYGKVWKRHRKVISESFRYEFIISQIPLFFKNARNYIEKEVKGSKGTPVDIMTVLKNMAAENVFQVFFGQDIDENIEGVKPSVFVSNLLSLFEVNVASPENLFFGASAVKLGILERNRRLIRDAATLKGFGMKVIQRRRSQMNSQAKSTEIRDLLGLLLEAQKVTEGSEDSFTDEEILHEFMTFLIAGMDTISHLLTIALYFFCKQSPEVQDLLLKEANAIAKAGSAVTGDMLNKCEYINAFLKESLRTAGPAPLVYDRMATVDHHIGDIHIPKGTLVNCLFIANNSNPEYYNNPQEFNMYRWIPGHPQAEEKAMKNPYIFTPFSAGQRNCIGQHFGMIEGKIIFSYLLANYEFRLNVQYKLRMAIRFLYEPAEKIVFLMHKKSESGCMPSELF